MVWCRQAPEESREKCSSIAGTSRKSMRSFASLLVVIALCATSALVVRAQTPSPRTMYTDALLQERTLRHEIEVRRSGASASALLKRVRSLVETYERMSRQFRGSDYMDNALWQGALLSADAFWTFGELEDRDTALEMFSELGAQFPRSSLVKDAQSHVKRLREARIAPRDAARPAQVAASAPATTTTLTSVRREVLPDVLRVPLELSTEVSFRSDRLDGPPRVFID